MFQSNKAMSVLRKISEKLMINPAEKFDDEITSEQLYFSKSNSFLGELMMSPVTFTLLKGCVN